MASFLNDLQAENAKKGLFDSDEISVSYPLGFPILDQLLGAVYIRKDDDGNEYKDIHLGIPAGSFTIFCGQTSSGKTTAAIQAAGNIVEEFGRMWKKLEEMVFYFWKFEITQFCSKFKKCTRTYC